MPGRELLYKRRVLRLVTMAVLLALWSCGPEDKCAGVKCTQGRVCQPTTGVCEVIDAGP